jgi:Hypothetical methyltransferase
MEAIGWLERLGRGEISSLIRRNLEVQLTPVEIERRLIKYGDFTKLNNRINNEISETTNQIMIDNPQERKEYHRQYGEARRTWAITPYDEMIKGVIEFSRWQIGDFGCGESKIMESIGSKGTQF